MKQLPRYLWAVCAIAGLSPVCLAAEAPSTSNEVQVSAQTIWRLPLPVNQTMPLVIPTWPDDTTYIELPEVVQDWFGRGFALEPRSQAGDFHLRVEVGGKRVGVVPLVGGARRTLHLVMADGRFLTLDLAPAAERRFAWRAIVFEDRARIAAAIEAAAAKERERLSRPVPLHGNDAFASDVRFDESLARDSAPPESRYQRATPRTMDGMLSLLRASVGLSAERVALFSRANPSLHIVSHPGMPAAFGSFDLAVRTAIRDDITDTLGLVVAVTNLERNHTLLFDPAGWSIRVGERVYRFDAPGSLVAFPGELTPGKSDLAFLILARAADGTSHRLLPDNDFRVTARLLERRPTVPVVGYDLSSESK